MAGETARADDKIECPFCRREVTATRRPGQDTMILEAFTMPASPEHFDSCPYWAQRQERAE